MGRAMGFGSEPTYSTHVVRQQRIRARAGGGGGWGCAEMDVAGCCFGLPVRWVTRVEHLWEECKSVSYKLLAMR